MPTMSKICTKAVRDFEPIVLKTLTKKDLIVLSAWLFVEIRDYECKRIVRDLTEAFDAITFNLHELAKYANMGLLEVTQVFDRLVGLQVILPSPCRPVQPKILEYYKKKKKKNV